MAGTEQRKSGNGSASATSPVATAPISDGSVKCSACGLLVPEGEKYIAVPPGAEGFPDIVLGRDIHTGCAAEWAGPADAEPTVDAVEVYASTAARFAEDVARYADSLSGQYARSTFSPTAAEYYVKQLDLSVRAIAEFFDASVSLHSSTGAHVAAASCAADSTARLNGMIKVLATAKGKLLADAGAKKAHSQDAWITLCLESFASSLAISAFRLQMRASAEYYSSGGAQSQATSMLLGAASRFGELLLDEHAHLLATGGNIDAMRSMVRGMVDSHAGLANAPPDALAAVKAMAPRMKRRLDMSDPRYDEAPYLALADLFATLGMRADEAECYAVVIGMRSRLGSALLNRARDLRDGKPSLSMLWDGPMPPDRPNSLVYALRAKESLQEAKELWEGRLRDSGQPSSKSIAPRFEQLIAECDAIVDAATKDCKVLIRTGRE